MQAMPGPSAASLHPRQQRLAALAVIAFAVLALGWTAARHLPAVLLGEQASPTPEQAPDGNGPEIPESRSLAEYPLFGRSADEGQVTVTAPFTELALTLRGTLAAPVPEQALAIIADADGRERSFRVGDELPGGATLERVEPGRVLIRFQGRREALPLRKPDEPGAPGRGGRAGTGDRRHAGAAGDRSPGLGELRSAFLDDPAAFAERISLQPVQENGEIVGMRVAAGMSEALMAQFGLRASDVITEVNGVPLDGMERRQEIVRQLRQADRLQLTLVRDGRSRQLTVPLGR